MADTRAAAILAAIRERWSKVAYVGLKPEVVPEPGHQPEWLPDVPRLVAAVEAARVLALAWEAAGGPGEPVHLVHVERRACGSDLLAAISAALAGEDGAGE